ncbi:microsomal signal peptidase-like protein 12 kDa subunit [Ophiobolus disseminans]|uniref:Signal peptidase complex subunit 1 n=1 Tax=Ophiobolus disseminans TaxID=1469910 RepID=A0A6A6ZRZ2_9PLEO|nr:microsomal signal peptidase-like protein 12 kDa subunit [Ophiobolus disseminans]
MSDQLLEQVRDAVEGQIDFEGQRLAEMLTTVLLGAAGIIAFFVGYVTQDIRLSLYVGLAGTALTFLVIVPPWPFYNKNPEGWLPARNATTATSHLNIDVDGKKVG